jgi:hypothetical protein
MRLSAALLSVQPAQILIDHLAVVAGHPTEFDVR